MRCHACQNFNHDPTGRRHDDASADSCGALRKGVEQGSGSGRIQHPGPKSACCLSMPPRKGFVIDVVFEDVETAKASGRTHFSEMLAYLKKHHASCRTILVEKTDRLYRNLKDWVTLDELDVEIHFVKENEIVSAEFRVFGEVRCTGSRS